jgi:lipid A 4'-phosphatase
MRIPSERSAAWPFALALTVCFCILFITWPELDRQISEQFYLGERRFIADADRWADWLYVAVPRLGQIVFAVVVCTLLAHALGWRCLRRSAWRAACAWALVVVLGVGLIAHEFLKNNVGRPRPAETSTMGGAHTYVPPFVQSDACRRNCSFVSGHAAIAFSLMAWGALAGPRWRWRWVLAGCACGAVMGAVRMLQGRHFFSDVVFAGLLVWWVQWALRQFWLLWIVQRRSGRWRLPQMI